MKHSRRSRIAALLTAALLLISLLPEDLMLFSLTQKQDSNHENHDEGNDDADHQPEALVDLSELCHL